MADVESQIRIENVVASSSIDQELELQTLADTLDVEFDPQQFPGVVYRTEDPDAAALIFESGKVVCTGADSVHNVHEAFSDTLRVLRELGIDAPQSPAVDVENIVACADLQQQLNLNAIAVGLGLETVEYEPEQFPGLVYRLDDPDVAVLLFGSGKLIITGAQHESEIKAALATVRTRLADLGLLETTDRTDPRNPGNDRCSSSRICPAPTLPPADPNSRVCPGFHPSAAAVETTASSMITTSSSPTTSPSRTSSSRTTTS